jgi:hypothetical protein
VAGHAAFSEDLRRHPPAEVGALVGFQLMRPGRSINESGTVVNAAGARSSRFARVIRRRHGGVYRALVQVSDGRTCRTSASRSSFTDAPPERSHRVRAALALGPRHAPAADALSINIVIANGSR